MPAFDRTKPGHTIRTASDRSGLWAICDGCGESIETIGHDESARMSRAAWVKQHKENR